MLFKYHEIKVGGWGVKSKAHFHSQGGRGEFKFFRNIHIKRKLPLYVPRFDFDGPLNSEASNILIVYF